MIEYITILFVIGMHLFLTALSVYILNNKGFISKEFKENTIVMTVILLSIALGIVTTVAIIVLTLPYTTQ